MPRPAASAFSLRVARWKFLDSDLAVTILPMKGLAIRRVVAILATCLSCAATLRAQALPTTEPIQQLQNTIAELAHAPADDCGWESDVPPLFSADTTKLESELFDQADAALLKALNASGGSSRETIVQVLDTMHEISERANKTWPAGRRFQYQLLHVEPVFVVQFHIRSRSTFSVFAVPALPPYPKKGKNTEWFRVGGDDERWGEHNSDESVELYELARGPSKLPRFLSKSSHVSCGDGQTGIEYVGYEWNPSSTGDLHEVLSRKGAVSGEVFPVIGKLETKGPKITLPYCWWSAIDSSVWATLCSVDTYDLSGDYVRFLSTSTNRPDLETVAKVIEYAQARDLRAVMSYSASQTVANKLVELMPPFVFNAGGFYSEPARDRETIDIEDGEHLRFALERRNGRWLVVQFALNP
jgi:hypothetical protein